MSKRPNLYGACYYCICTACSGRSCPYAHLDFKHCTFCHQRGKQPRLDCDYFRHYIKTKQFRFRPSERPFEPHAGTYILFTDRSVMVKTSDKIHKLNFFELTA